MKHNVYDILKLFIEFKLESNPILVLVMLIWIQSTSLKCWNAYNIELVFKPKEVWPQLP
jgi:hypothetical protein